MHTLPVGGPRAPGVPGYFREMGQKRVTTGGNGDDGLPAWVAQSPPPPHPHPRGRVAAPRGIKFSIRD